MAVLRGGRRRRRWAGVLLLACSAAGLGLSSAPSAAAPVREPFEARAGGDLFRLVVSLTPAVLQEDLLDPGAVTAQASLTSFGDSTAFASYPYPGSLPVAAQGLANGVLSQTGAVPPELADLVRLPDLPLVVTSTYPAAPDVESVLGPISMRGTTRQAEASAVAADGLDRSEATVRFDESSGEVRAGASVVLGGVTLAPTVVVHALRTEAVAFRGADGKVTLGSSLSISVEVLGIRLRVDDDGIHLADTSLALPRDDVLGVVDQLLATLSASGTTITVLPAIEGDGTVTSAALRIDERLDVGNGTTAKVSTVIGRTTASVTGGAGASGAGEAPAPPSDPGSTIELPGGSDGLGPLPGLPGGDASPETIDGVDAAARGLVPELAGGAWLFPVLAAAGVLLILSSTAFRKQGALPWSS